MFRDARSLTHGERLRTPICVVGAGAAGITLARDLAARGHEVLVLESGGLDYEEEVQALHEMEMTGRLFGPADDPYPVTTTRLRYFGGTTNHWAGYCRPLRPVDLETRPGLARSGWDLPYEELARWYPAATEVLGLSSDRFDPAHWAEHGHGPPLLHDDLVETVVFQLSPVNFGTRYRDELERSEAVTVLLHANATGLRTDESGRRVTEVAVRTLEGGQATVEAGVVVLAMGGLENPRLLLASNERGGIGNDHDLVGRFFCEHFQHTLGFAVVARPPEALVAYHRQTHEVAGQEVTVQSALVLNDDVLRREGLLGLEVQLAVADLAGDDVPGTIDGPTVRDLGAVLGAASAEGPARSVALCQVFAEQELNPTSRVLLTDEVDALGMRKAALHWDHTDLDRRSIEAGLAIVGRALGRRGLGRLQRTLGNLVPGEGEGPLGRIDIDPARATPDFHLAHGNHHMCTTRMAADPSQGVVDLDLRVHGTANLYVAGSSVFATPGVAAPTITLVALAARLADHLDRELS